MMKFTKEELTKNKFKYAITVDADTLKKSYNNAVKSLGKNAKVPGFRKGHVPLSVLERSIDPARLSEAEVNDAINLSIVDLIIKEGIELLDHPTVEVTKYVPQTTLEFNATVEIVPPVKLADPTKLKVKKPVAKIDKKQVDEVINNLRNSSAKKESVERAAKKGDEVIIDFTGLKDGVEFAGGKAKDYPLVLGSGAFIPGFEEGIEGHKPGEKFDVDVTFPKEYGAKELAGMKAVFKVEIKKVNELTLPELNDEFAKTISPDFETVTALRSDITKELTAQEESSNRQKYSDELIEALATKSEVEVPAVLVDEQMPQLKERFEQNLMYRGLSLDEYLKQEKKTEEQWEKDELRPTAEKRVRNSMVLSQFARQYNVEVSDEELAEYQAKVLSHYNNPKVKANFETPEAMRQMRDQLATDKAMQLLADLNEGNVKPSAKSTK